MDGNVQMRASTMWVGRGFFQHDNIEILLDQKVDIDKFLFNTQMQNNIFVFLKFLQMQNVPRKTL